ncbi:hypothetical protein B0H19DRAFT_1126877 [Mycena capillaripes]|nr:hypothetical protein B0H19DRAFT_1126877 [Mycena capillaripes]
MPPTVDDRQCRICLAGSEEVAALGRLIKPCLCKGSISFVHIKCLQRWRNTAVSQTAFFSCPQCHYQYRFARTRIVGIATNPVVVGAISSILFTILVLLSSFVTTFFMSWFEEPSEESDYYRYNSFSFGVSPIAIAQDIIRAALRILRDAGGGEDGPIFGHNGDTQPGSPPSKPRLLMSFIRRFLLGLPIVGASSIVHMLLSAPLLPVQFLARYRSSSQRRESSRDIASLIIIGLILVGAARALLKVYEFTQSLTKRLLLRAEDAILEVK